tara:strand:+ start:51595 stop:52686 length:1092 start_codon:yes stop_codon:yes gene_type:complete
MGLVSTISSALIAFNLIPHCGVIDRTPLKIQNVYIVSKQDHEQRADLKPEFAVRDEVVKLYAVVEAINKGRKMYITEADDIKLKGRIPGSKIRKPVAKDCITIDWSKVEADSKGEAYDNNNQTGNSVGIPYVNTNWKKGWVVTADVHPTTLDDQFDKSVSGLGTMRYKIDVLHSQVKYSTPGAKELTILESKLGKNIVARKRAEPKLAKVVYRNNEGNPTDFAFELFNTPYIWGSRQFDADQQIGSDCADLVVYARRRDGRVNGHRGRKQKYTWSTGLLSYTNSIVNVSSRSGKHFKDKNGNKIPWGKVKAGDIIYVPGHVGILYKDDGDGYFGRNDFWIDTIFREPRVNTIGHGGDVRRWRK